jgi:hypothetical protein
MSTAKTPSRATGGVAQFDPSQTVLPHQLLDALTLTRLLMPS